MEAATVLDQCIGAQLGKKEGLEGVLEAAKNFTMAWSPEAEAARTIALSLEYKASIFKVAKVVLYMQLGISALHNAKDGKLSYCQALDIEQRADRWLSGAVLLDMLWAPFSFCRQRT